MLIPKGNVMYLFRENKVFTVFLIYRETDNYFESESANRIRKRINNIKIKYKLGVR